MSSVLRLQGLQTLSGMLRLERLGRRCTRMVLAVLSLGLVLVRMQMRDVRMLRRRRLVHGRRRVRHVAIRRRRAHRPQLRSLVGH